MAVEINIPKPVIDYDDLENKPTLVTAHSELTLDDGTNPHGTTASDVGAYTTTETDNLLDDKVPYTGATADVDLGTHILNAQSIHAKGTGGNGHLGLKHQSAPSTAGGSESVLYADSSGLPKWKNDGNTVEQLAYQSAVNGKQDTLTETNFGTTTNGLTSKATPIDADSINIVDSADSNKAKRITFANLKVFLKGYFDTIYTTTSAVASQITTALSSYVPTSRTVNGKALSSNVTLTASDVGAPSGSGSSSGTNTGDETQSSILSKLGFVIKKSIGSSNITGTTSEVLVATFTFSANELTATEVLEVETQFSRSLATANATFRIRINTSNTLVGSTQIAQNGMGGNVALFSSLRRKFTISSGTIQGVAPSTSSATDWIASTNALLNASIDVTNIFYLFVTYTPANTTDVATNLSTTIKNF